MQPHTNGDILMKIDAPFYGDPPHGGPPGEPAEKLYEYEGMDLNKNYMKNR